MRLAEQTRNAKPAKPLSYSPDPVPREGMTQADFIPRNRSERIRKRAWRQIQLGRLASYEKLVALSLEAHLIR